MAKASRTETGDADCKDGQTQEELEMGREGSAAGVDDRCMKSGRSTE